MSPNPILKKLKLTEPNPVLIWNAPAEYQDTLKDVSAIIHNYPQQKYSFVHVFVKNKAEADKYLKQAAQCLEEDGYLWISYPKKSSLNYKSDISRDSGWSSLGNLNFEVVSQVSIDDDWSALRFRQVNYIKSMKRHFALSKKGKQRIKDNK